MSFLAGAVTGNLILNTSGFTGGIAGAIAAATSGGPSIAAPLLAALNAVTETAKAIGSAIWDAIKGAAEEFDNVGEAAEQAGVSTQFLSSVGRAAKDAGSSMEGLGDSLKFVNKNAAAAAEGEEGALKAFQAIGLSQQFVQENLSNTETLFYAVVDGISALQTPAQKTAAAMELMGRGGTSMLALVNQGSAGIKEQASVFDRLGASVTDAAAAGGDKFAHLMEVVDAAWDGIRNAVAEPILTAIGADAGNIEETVVRIVQWVRSEIPTALNVIAEIVKGVLFTVEEIIRLANASPLGGLLVATDALGVTSNASATVQGAADTLGSARQAVNNFQVQVSAQLDANAASSQIADKLRPGLQDVFAKHQSELESFRTRDRVAAAIGARRPS